MNRPNHPGPLRALSECLKCHEPFEARTIRINGDVRELRYCEGCRELFMRELEADRELFRRLRAS